MTTTPHRAGAGQQAASERRRARVVQVIRNADPAALSVAAVARAAGVHRSYLYRQPDLLDLVHQAAVTSSAPSDTGDVSKTSLLADLAHARDRARRNETKVRHLEGRLSELLGRQVWAATGLELPQDVGELTRELARSRQELADLRDQLDERDQELQASRAANRELITQLNASR